MPTVIDSPAEDVVALAAGAVHTCLLNADGGVTCWGNNGTNQLGVADTTSIGPQVVPNIPPLEQLKGTSIYWSELLRGAGTTLAFVAEEASSQAGSKRWGKDGSRFLIDMKMTWS